MAIALNSHAYLALGSNLGDRLTTMNSAINLIGQDPAIGVDAISSLYETEPMGGPPDQPNYINAVISIKTALTPLGLLRRMQEIENDFGRTRGQRWGPRTLDIDIVLYGGEVIECSELIVPHPRMRQRLFVLAPLSEIAPDDFKLPPDGASLKTILDEQLRTTGLTFSQYKDGTSLMFLPDVEQMPDVLRH